MYVTTPSDARYRIEHQDVVDIDHPGNVIAMLGLSLLVTGAATWAAINQVENPSGFVAIPALFALECLVVGFPMAIYGGATYAQSVGAASPRQFNATQTGNR